jgi:DNA-binding Lrp family transcriptional regulator
MPQITCPNCGTTINLENRREVDFKLIRNATDRHPRTFTDLLHITRLSRKTLNVRLKELCAEGILLKEEGMYKSNGASEFGNDGGHIVKGFSKMFEDKRVRTGLMLVALLASFSVSGYVLAMMVAPTTYVQPYVEPKALGTFTVAVDVNNVSDLYAWQAAIVFNSSQIKVNDTNAGDFMKVEYPYFDSSTTTSDGLVLLFGTLRGNVTGITGSGTLATVVFEYYVENYGLPSIVSEKEGFGTWLEDSTLANIPMGQAQLTLPVLG